VREAASVVAVIEQMQPDLGKVAYDDDESDRVFEDDSAGRGLIAKAGFSRESWKTAFDATLKGFMAVIPDAEVEAMFATLRTRAAGAADVTAEQRQAITEMVEEQYQIIAGLRDEGRAYKEIVRPLEARLRRLVPMTE
jgi:acylphosphatase